MHPVMSSTVYLTENFIKTTAQNFLKMRGKLKYNIYIR